MLTLSKQTDYALLALSALARREDAARISGGVVTTSLPAKDIAEQHGIPMEFLAKVLQKLAKARIVTSTYGPTGGYRLAVPASEVSVGSIMEIVDGALALTQCMRVVDNDCLQAHHCTIKGPLTRINEEILRVLNTLTLDKITEPEPAPQAQMVQIEMGYHRPSSLETAGTLR